MKMSIQLFVHDSLATTSSEETYLGNSNSEIHIKAGIDLYLSCE